jgi:phosphopantetheinyl transferase
MSLLETLIGRREVHVWIVRSDAYASEELLRRCLSHYIQRPSDSWLFLRQEDGKPELQDSTIPLAFNISHSDDYLAIAVCDRGYQLGVDVEVPRERAFLRLARRYFADSETAALERVPVTELSDLFYRYWTLKEARLKALGSGLRTPLASFSVIFSENSAISVDCADKTHEHDFCSLFLEGQVALAIALERGQSPARLCLINADEAHFGEPFLGFIEGSLRVSVSGAAPAFAMNA